MNIRALTHLIPGVPTSDGAGVKLRRTLGGPGRVRVDPFLMLDEFYTDQPDDYIAGFPAHPHRGFETVTYMLEGRMRHEDHLGNRGELGPGSVQWMTAGRGIIHSEMPLMQSGRMRGFQLWLNLPAADKMQPAAYSDIPAEMLPWVRRGDGAAIKVIAGRILFDGELRLGAVNAEAGGRRTDPLYVDVVLPAGVSVDLPVPAAHHVFVYGYEGALSIGTPGQSQPLPPRDAAVLGAGDIVRLTAGAAPARALLLAAVPLHEPVVQYGPFVMNTEAEIRQAILDFQSGRLAA